eukprot:CAMPEP_0175845108 /NCGR_PEP_ID=MMETSP0107_2-20121207/22027_1 /TAXON_ID=195067 ORGANISM="Goniomonas pacifica, Strain CCMP1869" /NCGR_SAMPLE_ID=MMETSP0107_2 /ASSEMBLY_ACC=CAM_ASM_000203 /LENGTH=43 /DNA_ID= /DNA_START= /DNA_END= /DNA_ORIENTATION=
MTPVVAQPAGMRASATSSCVQLPEIRARTHDKKVLASASAQRP